VSRVDAGGKGLGIGVRQELRGYRTAGMNLRQRRHDAGVRIILASQLVRLEPVVFRVRGVQFRVLVGHHRFHKRVADRRNLVRVHIEWIGFNTAHDWL
jgi:hypothetical protein